MPATVPAGSASLATGGAANDAHSRMHGRTLFLGENVLAYGADPSGVADSTAAIQAAMDAVAAGATARDRTVWFPGGLYKLNDGSGLTCSYDNVHFRGIGTGAGASGAVISVKNAYAFTHTSRTGLLFENLTVALRSGTTSGGGWTGTGSSRNVWKHCEAEGITGYAGALFKYYDTVGSSYEYCAALGPAGIGFDLRASTGFANLVDFRKCRAGACSTAGYYIDAGSGVTLDSCWSETNSGYGVYCATSSTHFTIRGHWFEDNYLDNVRLVNPNGCLIEGNRFFYNRAPGGGGSASANHISLYGTGNFTTIVGNRAQDAANNKTLYIDASTIQTTTVIGGAGFQVALVTDNGSNTRFVGTGDNTKPLEMGYRFGVARGMASGAGTPESNVAASVGSLYLRTDGGASTTLYIKESGTGNTGWVAK